MHLELVVPALFTAQAANSLPALELLLARGRRTSADALGLESWLFGAFGSGEFPAEKLSVPAGALTALAHGVDPGAHLWLRADPVHLRADRDRVILVPNQAFTVGGEEAEELAATLNRHFAGDFALHAVRPDAWCLKANGEMAIDAQAPIEVAGSDLDATLPVNRARVLLNEIQMALYEHPVNTAREARGDPVVNSVWLWGAGKLPAKAAGPWQSVGADDPVALGLARLAGMRHRPPGTGAGEWLARAPEDGRQLLVLDGMRGTRALGDLEGLGRRLRSLEEYWFAPLLGTLRSGRIDMLTIHVPDAAAAFETVRGDLRRFWRRPQPLAAYGGGPG